MADFPLISLATSLRRRWTYLEPIQPVHEAMSRHLIAQAVDAAAGCTLGDSPRLGRALVVGAGRCREIPLAGLLDRFEQVTVTDIDRDRLDRGLREARLTADQRRRLHIEIGDILAVTDPLLAQVRQCLASDLWTGPNNVHLVERLAAIVDDLQPQPAPAAPPYDLVVASCVLSQLHMGASDAVSRLFDRRFPKAKSTLRDHPPWVAAVRELAGRLQRAFVDTVTAAIGPAGRFYLSATPQVQHIYLAPQGRWKTRETYRMIVTDHLADFLDADRFTIEAESQWQWSDRKPTDTRQPGLLFDVEALVVRGVASSR